MALYHRKKWHCITGKGGTIATGLSIYKKMKHGIRFSGIKVDGDLIIDGHHRYLAALVAGISLDIYPSSKTSATTEVSWNEVDFDQNEWDTEAKILMLNTIDAEYNDLSIDDLNELLK
jgi:hypothetical protein